MNCTGNCTNGRPCDCCADVSDELDEPLTVVELLIMLAIYFVSTAFGLVVLASLLGAAAVYLGFYRG